MRKGHPWGMNHTPRKLSSGPLHGQLGDGEHHFKEQIKEESTAKEGSPLLHLSQIWGHGRPGNEGKQKIMQSEATSYPVLTPSHVEGANLLFNFYVLACSAQASFTGGVNCEHRRLPAPIHPPSSFS